MEITQRDQGGVTVVAIVGRLDSSTSPAAQERIAGVLAPGLRLVLDLSGCEYLSSAGLRVLLVIAKTLARDGGAGAVAGLSAELRDVMEITGFGNVFPSHETVAAAVAGLAGDGP